MKVFIGCYTKKISADIIGKGEGIYCFDFDSTLGELTLSEIIPAQNPSYLALSKDNNCVYAVEELDQKESPKVKAYRINLNKNTSSLTLISEREIPGSYACHISLTNSQKNIVIACYMSGNILVYPLDSKGEIGSLSQNIQHTGTGPNLNRQEAAHAHMIYPFGKDGFFGVDLGLDVAKAYKFDHLNKQFSETPELTISISKGAGARHMVVHPTKKYAFLFGELTAELFSFKLNENKFNSLEKVASLPANFNDTPSGAAIRIHPNGKFIYVSNREFDAISIFQFDVQSEKLRLLGHEPSGGKTPREINIDPTGHWLLAANQDSNNIIVFRIDQKSGLLAKHAVNNEVGSPSCIQFLDK